MINLLAKMFYLIERLKMFGIRDSSVLVKKLVCKNFQQSLLKNIDEKGANEK